MKNRKSTIHDVANQAGVSPMTVTRVLKYPSLVAPKTLERVQCAIAKLDYSPNAAAQSLTTSKTRQIAFTLSSDTTLGLANSYYATEMAGVINACAKYDYQCVVNVYDFSSLKEFVLPAEVRNRRIDGMVATGYAAQGVLDKLEESEIPIIFLGQPLDNIDFPVVTMDTTGVMTSTISYLAEKGHRRVGFCLASKKNDILQICSDLGVEAYFFQPSGVKHDSFKDGCENAKSWLKTPIANRPTAINGNDQWAVAFMSTIQEQGLNCPRDLSIISGDTTLCQWSSPKITSSGINMYDTGFKTAELLIDFLESPSSVADLKRRAAEIEVKMNLIERASVRDIRSDIDKI